jgi:hypothetical protein
MPLGGVYFEVVINQKPRALRSQSRRRINEVVHDYVTHQNEFAQRQGDEIAAVARAQGKKTR